ncbi:MULTISPECIES: GGDEF domain-containing response regulator [unclassified Campylobacter]|uniref:GGDEF domain-containing response regulator n=1 Tax=unclassified Campylobacter TaxID=2593542 RepID=UPI003D342653
MSKILVVDDNKALSKLIAKKMAVSTDMQVDVAHDFTEARTLIDRHKDEYFLALLDLNLPDAPDGEVVDYALLKGLSVIVLTGSIDAKTRESFIKKDIIDYVYKGNVDDVNFIFTMVDRLYKNKQYKVMIVEDSMTVRNELKRMLKNLQFEVFTAAHGEEAMGYFADHPDIRLVITDYAMPVKNGLEVLKELRSQADKNNLGVIAMTSPNDDIGAATFLKSGANDFLAKPFSKEELTVRVHNTIENIENIQQIANFANRDFLTGSFNRRYFYENMNEYMVNINDNDEPFAIGIVNIDNFREINDANGHEVGDKVLQALASALISNVKGNDIVARFGADEFCVVLKNISNEDAIKYFVGLRSKVGAISVKHKDKTINLTVSIGVSFRQYDYTVDDMVEFASEALYRAKEGGKNRVEVYE